MTPISPRNPRAVLINFTSRWSTTLRQSRLNNHPKVFWKVCCEKVVTKWRTYSSKINWSRRSHWIRFRPCRTSTRDMRCYFRGARKTASVNRIKNSGERRWSGSTRCAKHSPSDLRPKKRTFKTHEWLKCQGNKWTWRLKRKHSSTIPTSQESPKNRLATQGSTKSPSHRAQPRADQCYSFRRWLQMRIVWNTWAIRRGHLSLANLRQKTLILDCELLIFYN